jgi:hypothetical protein
VFTTGSQQYLTICSRDTGGPKGGANRGPKRSLGTCIGNEMPTE